MWQILVLELDFTCKIVLCIWKFHTGDRTTGLPNTIDFVEKNTCIVILWKLWGYPLLVIINFSIKTSNISKITPDDFYRRNTLPVEEEKKNNHSVNFAKPYHYKKKFWNIYIPKFKKNYLCLSKEDKYIIWQYLNIICVRIHLNSTDLGGSLPLFNPISRLALFIEHLPFFHKFNSLG